MSHSFAEFNGNGHQRRNNPAAMRGTSRVATENTALLLIALVLIGIGERLWINFASKYPAVMLP